jgi:Flp pilus assembly protein TadD
MQRIVFYGNCQAGILSDAYSTYIARRRNDQVTWIKAWLHLSDHDKAALLDCDLLLYQTTKIPFLSDIEPYIHRVRVAKFPSVCLGFLWPYGHSAHPMNQPIPYRTQGPYTPDDSDGFLNTRLRTGDDPTRILGEYLNDPPQLKSARLDRFFELYTEQQRMADEATGFDFGSVMESRFRKEHLFISAYHPGKEFAQLYISEILKRFVCSAGEARDAVEALARSPFEKGELPVHPIIARHFRLAWAGEGYRYATFTGERLTYSEYFGRYLAYQWNKELADLLATAIDVLTGRRPMNASELTSLADSLQSCLSAALESAEGYAVLGDLHAHRNDPARAIAAYKTAIRIEGERADILCKLADCFLKSGALNEASETIARALALAPTNPAALFLSSRILSATRRTGEAAAAARQAAFLAPHNIHFIEHLSKLLIQMGELDEARRVIARALAQSRGSHSLRFLLATAFTQKELFDECLNEFENIIVEHPSDRDAVRFYSHLAMQKGEHAAAEDRLRKALEFHPTDAELLNVLGQSVARQGRTEEAAGYVGKAVSISPEHPYYLAHAADLSRSLNDLERAEAHLLRATELAPRDSGLYNSLARIREMRRAMPNEEIRSS